MMLEKIFHVNQSLRETKTRLANLHSYRGQFDGVNKAMVTQDGVAHFEIEIGPGFTLFADVAEVPHETAECIYFRSLAGNIELAGMIEYYEVKDNLTEVVFTLDYEIRSLPVRLWDQLTSGMDEFLNQQLRRLQSHFEGIGTLHIRNDGLMSSELSGRFAQVAE